MFEHGDYVVGINQQVLLFVGRGPWNDEALIDGAKKLGKEIQHLDLTLPWAQLSCLVGECLMPPSTFDGFVYHSKIRKEKGLACLAIVILESDISNTIKQQLGAAYRQAEIEHQFFNSIESAIEWLAQQHFQLDRPALTTFLNQCHFLPKM
ncbi:hypothetical protein [Paraglaciecola sp.]|uniref:hypothetical protein n=1 Tax=Paraglaciecola sp. TaxID=1920173 RepID=UPI00273FAB90|nr:hypothetical protein [Paraglaciecola sp.]MDP5029603.1 hypothetical protein [Paraglaciecola sp.]